MTLSERLNPRTCRVCGSPSHSFCNKQLPEWRRRMEERLAKNGRVAEKALDR